MKKLVLLIFISLFAFNTFTNVALGDICVKNGDMMMTNTSDTSEMSDMPCHGDSKKDNKKNNKDCDGTCMCINICQNHVNIIYNVQNISILLAISGNLDFKDEIMSSIILSPPYKPPKLFS